MLYIKLDETDCSSVWLLVRQSAEKYAWLKDRNSESDLYRLEHENDLFRSLKTEIFVLFVFIYVL